MRPAYIVYLRHKINQQPPDSPVHMYYINVPRQTGLALELACFSPHRHKTQIFSSEHAQSKRYTGAYTHSLVA